MEDCVSKTDVDKVGVHLDHCCKYCGCKYFRDDECPVVKGVFDATYDCESCQSYPKYYFVYDLNKSYSGPISQLVKTFSHFQEARDWVKKQDSEQKYSIIDMSNYI